jgi:hypothetical protein
MYFRILTPLLSRNANSKLTQRRKNCDVKKADGLANFSFQRKYKLSRITVLSYSELRKTVGVTVSKNY